MKSVHTRRNAFASNVFLAAGIYGLLSLLPEYFLEDVINRNFQPPINHPEQFYGFLGVAVAWQCAFLLIASDVARFRMFVLPAILEKVSFGMAAVVLFARGRVPSLVACAGSIDLLFAALFVLAFLSSREADEGAHGQKLPWTKMLN
jgi:hypothetical protein